MGQVKSSPIAEGRICGRGLGIRPGQLWLDERSSRRLRVMLIASDKAIVLAESDSGPGRRYEVPLERFAKGGDLELVEDEPGSLASPGERLARLQEAARQVLSSSGAPRDLEALDHELSLQGS